MVRCGGCGSAFNALSSLSESMLEQAIASNLESTAPKLTPEIIEPSSGLPRTISADQSVALLKMLDELGGSDIRIEDKGEFSSTIIAQVDAEIMAYKDQPDDFGIADEESGIMEGDKIRSAVDSQKLATDVAAAAQLQELARNQETQKSVSSIRKRYKMIGAAVVLGLFLVLQMMHQSREALVKMPAFNNTVGQIYRALGQPVQPAWDITGWRFEVTTNHTEGDDTEELIVYSRVGNKSDQPLPYPLIGISLTDRFEETIGSRILGPGEYLPSDLDLRELVAPGNTFGALIIIKSATEDTTGFRLRVCYRLSSGQLRCKSDDFK
jgi:hypothetical protein